MTILALKILLEILITDEFYLLGYLVQNELKYHSEDFKLFSGSNFAAKIFSIPINFSRFYQENFC